MSKYIYIVVTDWDYLDYEILYASTRKYLAEEFSKKYNTQYELGKRHTGCSVIRLIDGVPASEDVVDIVEYDRCI